MKLWIYDLEWKFNIIDDPVRELKIIGAKDLATSIRHLNKYMEVKGYYEKAGCWYDIRNRLICKVITTYNTNIKEGVLF